MDIVLDHITKIFPARGRKKNSREVVAADDLNFTISNGKLCGLLGPSGCGKSTALNMISGLLKPTSGEIFFGDQNVTELEPQERGVGMVFQNYALYPHMSVFDNICFPLENLKGDQKLSEEERKARVEKRHGLFTSKICSNASLRNSRADSSSAWRLPVLWSNCLKFFF